MYKHLKNYFSHHVGFEALAFLLIGLGGGMIYNSSTIHPIRWAFLFIGTGVVMLLYAVQSKSK